MVVLNGRFAGLIGRCNKCYAILGYTMKDVYGDKIYCPVCRNPIQVRLVEGNNLMNKERKKNV